MLRMTAHGTARSTRTQAHPARVSAALNDAKPAKVRDATCRIAELARHNLLPGYVGIGNEAWGMVTMFYYRRRFATVTRTMQEIDPAHEPMIRP